MKDGVFSPRNGFLLCNWVEKALETGVVMGWRYSSAGSRMSTPTHGSGARRERERIRRLDSTWPNRTRGGAMRQEYRSYSHGDNSRYRGYAGVFGGHSRRRLLRRIQVGRVARAVTTTTRAPVLNTTVVRTT